MPDKISNEIIDGLPKKLPNCIEGHISLRLKKVVEKILGEKSNSIVELISEELMENADVAMYNVKESGKGSYTIFEINKK